MTITASRRIAAVSVALALPLALLAAPPASAATVGVTDWAGLKAAFLVGGDVVVLNADITAPDNEFLAIDASETIVLDLNGRTLTITNPGNGNAAISVPSDSSFTISATSGGTLTARGGNNGAGIGGGDGRNGGTTIINGGTITSTGGYAGAGIGGGNGGDGGTTIINGGTVTAIAISFAAGIGGGDGGVGTSTVITGGTITASGGQIAAGIGGGAEMDGGVLEVHGTPNAGAATDGGNPVYISTPPAAPITNPLPLPAGVGYSAVVASTNTYTGGTIELRFNYLITFDSNGGGSIAPQTINDGDTLTEPAAPTREGFTFAGWTSQGSAYDFSTPVTAPVELTATWTAALAETGAEITPAVGLASLLLAAGVMLTALRRRSTTHSA